MDYIFRGDKEFVNVKITEERKLLISNKLTNYEYVELQPSLFGNEREKINKCKLLISRLPKLHEAEIDLYLLNEFHRMGYVIIKPSLEKIKKRIKDYEDEKKCHQ